MKNRLGSFIRNQRLNLKLTLGQLALLVGYRNVAKGVRRLTCFEQTGMGKADLLVNIVEALNLDLATVEQLAEEDRQERLREWERWVSEPVSMHLVVRLIAAVYVRRALPSEITTPADAEAWACEFARQHRLRVCLVLSRRQSVWIDGAGQIETRTEARLGLPNQPWMHVKGRRFLLEGWDGPAGFHGPLLPHDDRGAGG